MLTKLIDQARAMMASDLHISCDTKPMIRVNGRLQYISCAKDQKKTANSLQIAEHNTDYGGRVSNKDINAFVEAMTDEEMKKELAEKGDIDFSLTDDFYGRCRVNIYQESGHYAVSIRLLNNEIPSCEALGIPEVVQNLVKHKYGLILITGPTGSGKSTTLAALLQKLNLTESLHIVTLEDPVEFSFVNCKSLINQRCVGKDTKSFASGLRSSLREDPDVILIGELRDAEALEVALQAAETGHLVLSTLHTRNAVSTINRIIDMLPEHKEQVRAQLAEVLLGVVAQELLVKKDGKGRVAALEIMLNNNAVANLIREGRMHELYTYLETSSNLGMVTMSKAIAKLKREGVI